MYVQSKTGHESSLRDRSCRDKTVPQGAKDDRQPAGEYKMPRIDKAERRDELRRKARDARFQGVRYNTLRAGEALVAFETERKTKVEGKPVRKVKGKNVKRKT